MRAVRLLVSLSLLGILGLCTQTAHAESTQKGLTLSPLRSEIEAAPGTSYDGVLTIKNSSDKSMQISLSADEFRTTNPEYDYAFTEESDITKWVVFSKSEVDLQPGQNKKIKYQIAVPLTAEPGGRYLSLFATSDTQGADTSIKSKQRIGSLIYMTVLGNITRLGELVSLSSPWFMDGQGNWSSLVRNAGTTHFRSRYTIRLENIYGGDVANIRESALVLPGTVRIISDKLPVPKFPGIYRVVYSIGLGDSPAARETRLIVYSPAWVTLLTIIVTVFGISWIINKLRARSSGARRYRRQWW